MYAYLIDTTDTTSYDTLVAYFTSDKTTSWTTVTSENLYVASGNPRGQGTWSSSTSDISDDTTTAIVFALVVGDVAEGSPYYITSAISLSGLTYSDTDMGDEYDYDFFDLVSNGGKSGVFAVPEPTSGLLFLMGIAGLGLKRKRV